MENLVLLGGCFLAGVAMRRSGRMGVSTPPVLNAFIIHLSLPALILLSVPGLRPTTEALLPASMPWLHFLLAALLLLPLSRLLKLSRQTEGALLLTGGLGNTSFLGLPMIEAWFGSEGVVHGILVDQLGSFMVLSTLGIGAAAAYAGGSVSPGALFRRIITFPPFIALLLALLLLPLAYPSWFVGVLQRLGSTLAPLALFSVGFQFRPSHLSGRSGLLAAGLGFKLFLAPLLLLLFYHTLLGISGFPLRITLFEAAMPPMITAGIVAADHKLDPDFASLMVTVGTLLSFVSLALWHLLLASV